QHVGEGATLVTHLGQDEVAGTVDDARQPLDAVGRQTFTQRLDDRNATGYRGLEGDDHALLPGSGEDRVAMYGDQRLVRGNHMLAVGDRLHDYSQGQGVVGHLNVTADVARGVGVPGGNVGHLNRPSCPAGNLLGVALQNIEGATAYGAQTTYTHFDRFQTRNPT